jgi:hypothetical protein
VALVGVDDSNALKTWLECIERNPDAVTDLAKLCNVITLLFDQ